MGREWLAIHLHRAGVPVNIFEASDDVGGRVRTDLLDGFPLDRGFQVYLDAYPSRIFTRSIQFKRMVSRIPKQRLIIQEIEKIVVTQKAKLSQIIR